MRIITWNVNNASEKRGTWEYLLELGPDIALIQEVNDHIPEIIEETFDIKWDHPLKKEGGNQTFKTAILVKKGKARFVGKLILNSKLKWVNDKLERYRGCLFGWMVEIDGNKRMNVISVHSPAWSLNESWEKQGNSPSDMEVMQIRLEAQKEKVFATEILWNTLDNTKQDSETWVVGGDFNSSETFDPGWQNIHPEFKKWMEEHKLKTPTRIAGSREIIDRMNNLGLIECLRPQSSDKIIPTFKNRKYPHKSFHQIDHLYVTKNLYSMLNSCVVGDQTEIFDKLHLSDHLPIIADFK